MAARASETTAPSMQPPETEPTMLFRSSTRSWLPTGRGEEPQVVTTVASATSRPSSSQASACASTSSVPAQAPALDSASLIVLMRCAPPTSDRVPREQIAFRPPECVNLLYLINPERIHALNQEPPVPDLTRSAQAAGGVARSGRRSARSGSRDYAPDENRPHEA